MISFSKTWFLPYIFCNFCSVEFRKNSWLWNPIQTFEFPAILPWVTHDAIKSVNRSINLGHVRKGEICSVLLALDKERVYNGSRALHIIWLRNYAYVFTFGTILLPQIGPSTIIASFSYLKATTSEGINDSSKRLVNLKVMNVLLSEPCCIPKD